MANTNNKQWILTIYESADDPTKARVHSIKGGDLVELLGKLPLLIIEVQSRILREGLEAIRNDDIPF